jgi:hypothetical protein
MQSSDKLYSSLNKVLGHSGTPAKLDKYKDLFNNLIYNNMNDIIIFHIFLYFFPFDNCMEQNKDCFWFENYRKEGVFTEYNFAIELLDIFDEYLKIKSTDLFKDHIKLVVEKLGDYKNVRNFVKLIPHENLFAWIVAYLTKDNKYFQLISDKQNIIPKEFQKDQWIINVGSILLEKTFNFYCLENARLIDKNNSIVNTIVLNDKRNQIMIDKLLEEIHSIKEKLDEVQKTNSSLENGLKDLQERVAKIELRDTIKLSMTYLYNILHYKFNSSEGKKDKYSDKLNEMLKILEDKKPRKYNLLKSFIKDIQFGVISKLNEEAHPVKKRNLEDITKYLQSSCNTSLREVVEFLKKLPNLDLFIELNVLYFKNPAKAENLFLEKQSYEKAYKDAFE